MPALLHRSHMRDLHRPMPQQQVRHRQHMPSPPQHYELHVLVPIRLPRHILRPAHTSLRKQPVRLRQLHQPTQRRLLLQLPTRLLRCRLFNSTESLLERSVPKQWRLLRLLRPQIFVRVSNWLPRHQLSDQNRSLQPESMPVLRNLCIQLARLLLLQLFASILRHQLRNIDPCVLVKSMRKWNMQRNPRRKQPLHLFLQLPSGIHWNSMREPNRCLSLESVQKRSLCSDLAKSVAMSMPTGLQRARLRH